ncbi:MAG: hypothetical protein HS122_02200 [Opitutaceae bacterium]|nr:hypothetical protein [Opitutaceae bacterium]
MTRKAIVVLGSSVSALLAMGAGVTSYQQMQREQREALKATVVAMEFFDGTMERVKSTIMQSTDLREDLLRRTDALLQDTVSSERELLDHSARVAELGRRRAELSPEASRILAEARAGLGQASEAMGKCEKIIREDKLKASQSARIAEQIRSKTEQMQGLRNDLGRFESLVARCEALNSSLESYAAQNREALERIQAIKKQAEERRDIQRTRQEASKAATERLSKLQAELQHDLEALRPEK